MAYGQDPFGEGPFGSVGGVLVPAPHGVGTGYGGVPYGTGAYGSAVMPLPPPPLSAGYGAGAYGQSAYGSLGMVDGSVSSAVSLNGFQIEIFFSTAVTADGLFFNTSNYIVAPVFGAAPDPTITNVAIGSTDANGPTSVVLTHTGTTLGGRYDVSVQNVKTYTGMPFAGPTAMASAILMNGAPPGYVVTPTAGDTLDVQFDTDMLTEAMFSPGIEDPAAYQFNTTYPVPITVSTITHPTGGDASLVTLEIVGQTSATYNTVISPADAIIYDGSVLPSAAPGFAGTPIGTGTSTIGLGRLLLSKNIAAGGGYGWRFADITGKILPNSSFRCEITIDVPSASFTPPLFDTTMATFDIADGALQVTMTLLRSGGADFLTVASGAFFVSIPTNWSTASSYKFGLVRNQKAGTYTILVNDTPVNSALVGSYTGVAVITHGAEFILDPLDVYTALLFPIEELNFTSSQTVFSGAWNFLHGQGFTFQGNDGISNDTFKVDCGPLVKGWGDATPATKQDVEVRVNGTPVEVASVNPYLGVIVTVIPIPLTPPGTTDVEVDYIWFPSPVMEMAGLNVLGVVLNKYDLNPGNNIVFSPGQFPGGGSKEGENFPFGLVLGPKTSREPEYISHRFLGFEKPYTAALNSPTTLLLNRSNHTVALPDREQPGVGESITYQGNVDPTLADPVWELLGLNSTDITADELSVTGVLPVVDESTGSFSIGQPTVYSREIDVSNPNTIIVVPRFVVDLENEDNPVVPDGVFTGVGFGAHNDQYLYFVGALLINDVQHLGMLTEISRPEEVESWSIASAADIRIETPTTFTMQQSALPTFVREETIGDLLPRFQIIVGTQAGVYEIVQIVDNTDDTATVTISGVFPEDPQFFGNANFTLYFEQKWDGDGDLTRPQTYRLVVVNDNKTIKEGFAQLFIGGSLTGLVLTMSGGVPAPSKPADSVLLFPTSNRGQVFWGSLSRKAMSTSLWDFFRYGTEPASTTFHFRGIVVAAEMTVLPEDDANNIWFVSQGFGYSEIDSTVDALLLKSTSADNMPGVGGVDLTFGYGRIEAFLDRTQVLDLDTTYRVESGTRGSGDAHILVRDTEREVRLATLLYEETATDRFIVDDIPSVSLSGLLLPEQQVTTDEDGWTKTGSLTLVAVQGQVLQYQQAAGESISYSANFSDYFTDPLPSKGRLLEMRLKVESLTTTDGLGNTGLFWQMDADDTGIARGVGVFLRTPVGGDPARVVLFDVDTATDVTTFDFDWQDQAEHTYRTIIDPDLDTVTMVLDDTVVGTVAFFANFTLSGTSDQINFGFANALTTSFSELCSFSASGTPPSTYKRTLGVWLGGDFSDIDNWEIPRTDALTVPNSDPTAVVEEMDWRVDIEVRIHRDPQWGVTILRPDLAPPPFFTGDFATQITEPSAGWINVEYQFLPLLSDALLQDTLITELQSETEPQIGFVAFGALDPASVTQQRWQEVRYRIYEYPTEDFIAPHHMVLNQYNLDNSGEFTKDITVEQVVVLSISSTTVSLRVTNIFADRVFNLEYVDENGDQVTLQPSDFTFDKEAQLITLNDGFSFRPLPQGDADVEPPDGTEADNNDSLNPLPSDPPISVDDIIDRPDPSTVHIPVTVRFAPGMPVTDTYLKSQPLLDGVTLLNEGTPPITKSLVSTTEPVVVFGSQVDDPTDPNNPNPDYILNDPFRTVDFVTIPPNGLYENIEFFEVDNDGLTGQLSSICDDQSKLAGLHELGLEGEEFLELETFNLTDGTPGQSPKGPAAVPVPFQFMAWSGGATTGNGNLNQGFWGPPPPLPPAPGSPVLEGTVPMGVIGILYDTVAFTTEVLYFDKQVPFP